MQKHTSNRVVRVLLAASFAVASVVVVIPAQSVGSPTDKPLPFAGFYWSDAKPLQPEKGGCRLKDITIKKDTYPSCSKPFPKGYALGVCNTLVVSVTNTASITNRQAVQMMKWYVTWDGATKDESLVCSDQSVRATDEEWLLTQDGEFEFPLPQGAVTKGSITKIGFTLMSDTTYGDVVVKASLTKK